MEDKMLMEGLLWDTKEMCDLCMHGAIESGTEGIHETFLIGLKELLTMQHEIYMTMNDQGWYQTTNVTDTKLDQAKQKFQKLFEEEGK